MHTTQATTECKQQSFDFQGLGSRRVEADFSGGHLSSDGGALLLREVDRSQRLCEELAKCFSDSRDERFVEHDLTVMLRQRIAAIALGYEDINDHDKLRLDPLLATVCGRADVLGLERHLAQDVGKPLAGKSTLNRLELGAEQSDKSGGRTRKIAAHADKIEALLLRKGVQAIPRRSKVIVLDFDATDDRIHGNQEGRFYHGAFPRALRVLLRRICLAPLGSTATTGATATCRSTASAVTSRCGRSCAPQTAMAVMARWRLCKKSSPPFANVLVGTRRSSYVATAASAVINS